MLLHGAGKVRDVTQLQVSSGPVVLSAGCFFLPWREGGGQDSGSCLKVVRLGWMASDIMGKIVK